jgi:virginiamycin A acetyltransferase
MLGMVTLEQDVLLGPAVQILSGPNLHGINSLEIPIREQPGEPVRVTVGQDSWIGAGSILLASIAPQTVVGAGSIVTKQFEPRSILVGNPARVLRSRYNH